MTNVFYLLDFICDLRNVQIPEDLQLQKNEYYNHITDIHCPGEQEK